MPLVHWFPVVQASPFGSVQRICGPEPGATSAPPTLPVPPETTTQTCAVGDAGLCVTRAVYIAPLSTRWVKLKLPLALKDWLCKAGGGSLFVSDSPTASPGDSPEIVPLTRNELVVHATAIPGGALFWTVPDPPPVTAHVCEIGPRALPPVTDSTYAVPLGWGGKEKDVAPFEDVVDRTVARIGSAAVSKAR